MALFHLIPRTKHIASHGAAAWLGGVHLVVDAVTVSAVLRCAPPSGAVSDAVLASAFAFVLGYDLLAFAGQLPLGALLDRVGGRRAATVLGVILALLSLLFVRGGSLATLVLAGLGNALFHVGAGAMVVDGSEGKAAPVGRFVAPGALGLGLGLALGKVFLAVPLWPFHIALVAGVILAWLLPTLAVADPVCVVAGRSPMTTLGRSQTGLLVLLLFASVFIRSLVGTVACDGYPRGLFLLCALPVAVFLGKLSGGILADRWGFAELALFALLSSAPLLAFAGGSLPMTLVGLLLFQMTMPVTLAAMYRLLPHRPASGFGFLCVALVLGVVTAQAPGGWRPAGMALFLLVVASAAMLFLALYRLAKAPNPSLASASPSTLSEVQSP